MSLLQKLTDINLIGKLVFMMNTKTLHLVILLGEVVAKKRLGCHLQGIELWFTCVNMKL